MADAIGGVRGAIENHAQDLWVALTPFEQFVAIGLFSAITERRIDSGGGQYVRRPQTLYQIASWLNHDLADLTRVVRHYSAPDVCFLQDGVSLDETSVVDLSHEALIRQWPALQAWISTEADRASSYIDWRRRSAEYIDGLSSLLSGPDLDRAIGWAGCGATQVTIGSDVALEWRPNAAWAQRYLSRQSLKEIRAAIVPKDAKEARALALAAANAELQPTLAFIDKSKAVAARIGREESLRLERERDLQSQLADAANAQALRARRQVVFLAIFGVLALGLALFSAWSWHSAIESAHEANRLKLVAENAAIDAALHAVQASNSASAAEIATLRAQQSATKQGEAAFAAETARQAAEAATQTARIAQRTVEKSKAELATALIEISQRRLVRDADGIFAGRGVESEAFAMQLALAAYRLSNTPEVQRSLQSMADGREAKVVALNISKSNIVFSPNRRLIVSGAADYGLRLWDAHTGALVGNPLTGHSGIIYDVAFNSDGKILASVSRDSTIRLWDVGTGESIGRPFRLPSADWGLRVAISPTGDRVASAGPGSVMRIWETASGRQIDMVTHGGWLGYNSFSFSPDGSRLMLCDPADGIVLKDARTGESVEPIFERMSCDYASFSPDGVAVASLSDGQVIIWNARTGRRTSSPSKQHTGYVKKLAFNLDGRRLVLARNDKTLLFWDVLGGTSIGQPLSGHIDGVSSVAFSPDGNSVISSGVNNSVMIWDARASTATGELVEIFTHGLLKIALSSDGSRVVAGSSDHTLALWDAYTGKVIGSKLVGHTAPVRAVSFSPNDGRIASGSADTTIRQWDSNTGKSIGMPLVGHTAEVLSIAYNLDGSRIVSGDKDGTLILWDSRVGDPVGKSLNGHVGPIGSVAFSPDGRIIASGGSDKTLRLWNAHNGEPIGLPIKGHGGWVTGVAFSPDGRYLVSSSEGSENTLVIRDARTGAPIGRPLMGNGTAVHSVAFSPDGQIIVSANSDKSLRFWDTRTGEPIGQPLRGVTTQAHSVAFSPDGRHIVSGSGENTIKFWLSPAGWADKLCRQLTRNLSPEEWDYYVGRAVNYTVQCSNLPLPTWGEFPAEELAAR